MRPNFRAFALAATLVAATASADKIANLERLKKGDPLPAGQAALLMVIDRGTQHSSVKRPEPASFTIVSAADGKEFRLTDVDDPDVRLIAPGRYYLRDAYSQSRSLELLGIHDASQAFEVKAGVLNYAGAWKFSNDTTKNTGRIGLDITYAVKPLEHALKAHAQFVAAGQVFVTGPGGAAKALGGQ